MQDTTKSQRTKVSDEHLQQLLGGVSPTRVSDIALTANTSVILTLFSHRKLPLQLQNRCHTEACPPENRTTRLELLPAGLTRPF